MFVQGCRVLLTHLSDIVSAYCFFIQANSIEQQRMGDAAATDALGFENSCLILRSA